MRFVKARIAPNWTDSVFSVAMIGRPDQSPKGKRQRRHYPKANTLVRWRRRKRRAGAALCIDRRRSFGLKNLSRQASAHHSIPGVGAYRVKT
jgi:hypothetical protein